MKITNFRDIGGYETTDGMKVKEGCFFRSSAIRAFDEEDKEAIPRFHLKTILDLRSPMEAEKFPDDVPDGCKYIHCSAIPMDNEQGGNFDITSLMNPEFLSKLPEYIETIYKNLPFNNEAYKIMFELIKNGETPLVFHCSAGKDRTGFGAYLILKTLGVPDDMIMYDYMLSNEFRKNENKQIAKKLKDLSGAEELLYVKEKYLKLSIKEIKKRYGDFNTYLEKEYGITESDIKALKDKYLY